MTCTSSHRWLSTCPSQGPSCRKAATKPSLQLSQREAGLANEPSHRGQSRKLVLAVCPPVNLGQRKGLKRHRENLHMVLRRRSRQEIEAASKQTWNKSRGEHVFRRPQGVPLLLLRLVLESESQCREASGGTPTALQCTLTVWDEPRNPMGLYARMFSFIEHFLGRGFPIFSSFSKGFEI